LTATGAASRIRTADPENPNAGNAASAAPAILTSSSNESVNLLVLLEESLLLPSPVIPTTHRAADSAGKAMRYVANAVQHTELMQSPLQCSVLRQHTSAYASIRQHTSAYVGIRQAAEPTAVPSSLSTPVASIRQHTPAYVSIRQHTSAYVSIRQAAEPTAVVAEHTCSVPCCRFCTQPDLCTRHSGPPLRDSRQPGKRYALR
jgi:hypothetical protein